MLVKVSLSVVSRAMCNARAAWQDIITTALLLPVPWCHCNRSYSCLRLLCLLLCYIGDLPSLYFFSTEEKWNKTKSVLDLSRRKVATALLPVWSNKFWYKLLLDRKNTIFVAAINIFKSKSACWHRICNC